MLLASPQFNTAVLSKKDTCIGIPLNLRSFAEHSIIPLSPQESKHCDSKIMVGINACSEWTANCKWRTNARRVDLLIEALEISASNFPTAEILGSRAGS